MCVVSSSVALADAVSVASRTVAAAAPPAADVHVEPLLVSTFPDVLGATNATALVPLPRMTLLAVSVAAPVPPFATGSVPVTPDVNGSPVAFVSVPDVGVPRIGVTSVGEVAKTAAPEPVSSVKAAIRFALEGVARNVKTPVPAPVNALRA